MYKRILIALDGSVSARLALEQAFELAQASGARLMVAYVVSHDVCERVGAGDIERERALNAGARRQIDQMRDVCKHSHVRCTARIIDAHGTSIPGALMQAAQVFEADLIVMGAHGPRAVRRHLLGSVAETVLRSSHVPVLAVRDHQRGAALAL